MLVEMGWTTNRATRMVLLGCAVGLAGCAGLIGLDPYRPCNGAECDGGAAEGGSAPDATSDAEETGPAVACKTSADCALPNPACSNHVCVGVSSLVQSTTDGACALMTDQTLWCWGHNDVGQLGSGVVGGSRYQPQPVSVLPTGTKVVEGGLAETFGCARTSDNTIYCWGQGATGATQVLVGPAAQLSVGSTSACARLLDSSVYCWGKNDYGDIGCDADAGEQPVTTGNPRQLLGPMSNIAEIQVGLYASCARTNNTGQVLCFGSSTLASLGVAPQAGTCQTTDLSIPGVTGLTTSDFASCARTENADYYCWGPNADAHGLLWQSDPSPYWAPPKLHPLGTGAASIAIGWYHSCALMNDGSVQCWGQNDHHQAGGGGDPAAPATVTGLSSARGVSTHRGFSCALQQDGQVLCWGDNEFATIGPGGGNVLLPKALTW